MTKTLDSSAACRQCACIDSARESEEKFRLISEQSMLGIVIIQDSVVKYCNAAACRLVGYSEAEVLAWGPDDVASVFHPEDRAFVLNQMRKKQAGETGDVLMNYTCRFISKSGRTGWVELYSKSVQYNGTSAVLATLIDITERKEKEEEFANMAYLDLLTGLPNRKSFYADLAEDLTLADRYAEEKKGAVLFLDLDNFKNVNDTLGHDAGDALLRDVAVRLKACLRQSDKIYRIGGDEFSVILHGLKKDYNVARVAEKINKALAKPFSVKAHDLYVTSSIGISVFPDDGVDADEMIKNADMAMYAAKEEKKCYRFFTRKMNRRAMARMTLENELRTAAGKGQFVMHYQPIADENDVVRGMEALIRWDHPDRGLIPPARFIPVLEDMGDIIPVGRWALFTSCAEVRAWNDAYGTDLFVSVNVSALQFRDDRFVETVEEVLSRTGLRPDLLKLEITESVIMKNPAEVMRKIKVLQSRGVEFSIDDFGTGYSSLGYLRDLPVNALKIDRSFVVDAVSSPDNREIIKTIIAMSRALKKKTIAEGIETAAQKELLKRLGCDMLQGYFYYRPLPAADFQHEIVKWQALSDACSGEKREAAFQ